MSKMTFIERVEDDLRHELRRAGVTVPRAERSVAVQKAIAASLPKSPGHGRSFPEEDHARVVASALDDLGVPDPEAEGD